jgi:hypothetical protein
VKLIEVKDLLFDFCVQKLVKLTVDNAVHKILAVGKLCDCGLELAPISDDFVEVSVMNQWGKLIPKRRCLPINCVFRLPGRLR